MKNFLKRLNTPAPLWLILFALMCGTGMAAAVLPYFATGTAQFGPGGNLDLGSVGAGITSPGPSDPQLYNNGQVNANLLAPLTGVVNLVNCTTATCNDANKQDTLSVAANGVTAIMPVLAAPSPSGTGIAFAPTPGPVAPCYVAAGTQCANTLHAVYGTLTATTTGVCSANSDCAIRAAGSSVNLAGNAQFDQPDGAWDVDCSTFSAAGWLVTTGYVSSQTIEVVNFYNANGTAVPDGTGEHVGFYCVGP